jgi:hypothetical protein
MEKDWFPQRRKGAKKNSQREISIQRLCGLPLRLCAFAGTIFASMLNSPQYT